jgi:hypothetical protein
MKKKRRKDQGGKSPLDEMHAYLYAMPSNKKEAFVFLVRTKNRKDLKDMRLNASKNDEDELVKLLDAAMTLRTFVESGIPLQL